MCVLRIRGCAKHGHRQCALRILQTAHRRHSHRKCLFLSAIADKNRICSIFFGNAIADPEVRIRNCGPGSADPQLRTRPGYGLSLLKLMGPQFRSAKCGTELQMCEWRLSCSYRIFRSIIRNFFSQKWRGWGIAVINSEFNTFKGSFRVF